MITVEYAPGGSDAIHRHDAHAFVYMLEGSMVMQVKGGKEITLTPGQTFYEGPNDIHVVGRNASSNETSQIPGFLCQGQERSGAGASEVTRGVSFPLAPIIGDVALETRTIEHLEGLTPRISRAENSRACEHPSCALSCLALGRRG